MLEYNNVYYLSANTVTRVIRAPIKLYNPHYINIYYQTIINNRCFLYYIIISYNTVLGTRNL